MGQESKKNNWIWIWILFSFFFFFTLVLIIMIILREISQTKRLYTDTSSDKLGGIIWYM
jgi:TRAP-type mannitol/chloroaromatic compound transport system permease small subunit